MFPSPPADPALGTLLYDGPTLTARIAELGREISTVYGAEPVVAVTVLKGALFFTADLLRHLTCPVELGILRIATYGEAQQPQRRAEVQFGDCPPLEGRHVLVLDDILDTGHSLRSAVAWVEAHGPATLRVAVCIAKAGYETGAFPAPHFIGFLAPRDFLIGYGLDWAERHRNLYGIFALPPQNAAIPAPME